MAYYGLDFYIERMFSLKMMLYAHVYFSEN